MKGKEISHKKKKKDLIVYLGEFLHLMMTLLV